MDKKLSIAVICVVILVVLVGIFAFMPHYKSIEMSGYTFEVPQSNIEVKNNSINYNTYMDTENDLNIKTWACKDINDTIGTVNGSIEMGMQLGENMGTNITYNNFSVYNQSGRYTYFESDINNSCIILITSKNLDTIEHILETMNKPKLNVGSNPFNMTVSGLVIDGSNDTVSDNQSSDSKSSSVKTSSKYSSKSSSGSNNGYHWSEQYGDYVKEYTDSNGVQHIDSKKGYKSSYNPRTNELKEENYEALL